MILVVFLLFNINSDVFVRSIGTSFEESFNSRSAMFDDHDREFRCYLNSCALCKSQNVKNEKFGFEQNKNLGYQELHLRNDCVGNQCCTKGRFLRGNMQCTPYTTGWLTSIDQYGFGSYVWTATALIDRSSSVHFLHFDPFFRNLMECIQDFIIFITHHFS